MSKTAESNPKALVVPRDNIHPRPVQPRHLITDEMVAERRADMKKNGQMHSILAEEDEFRPGHYWINDGEVKWRASYSDRDWIGLPMLRIEVEGKQTPEQVFERAALANDNGFELTDYDWCLTVAHMYTEFARTFEYINARFGKGRNWAEDFWAIHNGASKMPGDLGEALLGKLTVPDNKTKAKIVAGAPNARLQRDLMKDFDTLTVEGARARVAAWERTHKPKAPKVAASASNGAGGGTSWFGGSGVTGAKPRTTSKARPVTNNRPDARKECEGALDAIEGRVRHIEAWWGHLSPTAKRELRVRVLDIAGALEDLPK